MNQYKYLFFLITMLIVQSFNAQLQFQKKYESTNSSRAYSISITQDSGFILAGSYDVSGFLSAEYYIIKLDKNGDTLWANTYGPKVDTTLVSNRDGSGNEAYDVIQTFDLGYMVVGEAHAFGAGASDVFALKLTQNGDTIWKNTYGGINSDYSYKVIQLSDSGYVISGYTETYGLGIRDIYVLRLNKLGDTLWTNAYGGNGIDGSNDMVQTEDGGFAIVGNTFTFGSGVSDVYVIKIDKNGNLKWANAYGGTMNDFGNAITVTKDSGIVISGSTESFGSGQRDVYVFKIDSIGNLVWSKTFGGSANETGKSIQELPNKDLVVFGNTRSFGNGFEDYYLLKLNSFGDTIFTRTYGGTSIDYGESIKQTSDKGFVMAGYTNSFNTWNYDVYLVKTDSLGNSGCHQKTTSTVVTNPLTIKTNTATIVSNGSDVGKNNQLIKIGNTLTNPVNICNINSMEDLIDDNQIIVFPNPTNDYFSIQNNSRKANDYIISITNIQGKLIKRFKLNNENKKIDISSFEKGVYFVKIETPTSSILKKIVKL